MTATASAAVTPAYLEERSAPPADVPGGGAGGEQRHRHRVHRGDERSDARVDDAGGEKQLERVGRNPEEIEQERHRRREAAEEAEEPGERQLRVLRHRNQRVGEPSREQHEAQREELPRVREVEGRRHDDVGQPPRLAVEGIEPIEQGPARLDQRRQDDEQVAGDEGDHQRAVRLAEDVSGSNRRERADQPREHPQAHEQRHRDIRREVDLQPAQLLQAHRPGRVRRNGKQSVGREAADEAGGAGDGVFRDLQDVERAAACARRRPARCPG